MPQPRPVRKKPVQRKPAQRPQIPGRGNVTGGTVNFHSPVNIPGGHNITGSQFSARRINITLGTPSQQTQALRAQNAGGKRKTGSAKSGARSPATAGNKKKNLRKQAKKKVKKPGAQRVKFQGTAKVTP
ncbi:MAG: hypothetical protein Q7K42_01030 [Candidatus Diapherotrites archaeon]|nr:hypothetical protein [Candidatus Diapherotrites archaeon]